MISFIESELLIEEYHTPEKSEIGDNAVSCRYRETKIYKDEPTKLREDIYKLEIDFDTNTSTYCWRDVYSPQWISHVK